MGIIETILTDSRRRLAERMRLRPLGDVEQAARDAGPGSSLFDALSGRFSVVAEHKRRSPSGGVMSEQNCAGAVASYEATPWISAISVLTDEDHFGGSLGDIERARTQTRKPILRKDFIYDPYQVYEARAAGADAILLMAGLHADAPQRLGELYELARDIGLDVLVEVGMMHGDIDAQIAVVPERARIWGVNSRDFVGSARWTVSRALASPVRQILGRDMTTSLTRHQSLRDKIPDGKLAIAESGIHNADQLRRARELGYDAALIGTAFVAGPRPIREVIAEFGAAFQD